MKTKRLIFTLTLLLLIGRVICQVVQPTGIAIRDLAVGEKVPNIHIGKLLGANGKIKSATIFDFKDQLLILDFMHSRCSGCIKALPIYDSLQKQFGERLRIIPVTYEKEGYMRDFLKNDNYLTKEKVQLTWAIEDSILSGWFKFKLISHLVWIYRGEVKAITGKEYVKAENIQTILSGKSVDWPIKADILDFDYSKPLFPMDTNRVKANGSINYTAISGYRNGLGSFNRKSKDTIIGAERLSVLNYPILSIYQLSWARVIPKLPLMTLGRIIFEVKDSTKYIYRPEFGYEEIWNRKHGVCYELVMQRPCDEKAFYQRVIDDLDYFFGLNGRWENRRVKCLILKPNPISRIKKPDSKLHEWETTTIDGMIFSINYQTVEEKIKIPPVVDETNYKGALEFLGKWTNVNSLRKAFESKGIDMVEEEREIQMFVLTEK